MDGQLANTTAVGRRQSNRVNTRARTMAWSPRRGVHHMCTSKLESIDQLS